jgi:hypothetical protein
MLQSMSKVLKTVLNGIKFNRAAGIYDNVAEHKIHSFLSLISHFKFVCSIMLNHLYIPNIFSCGISIPVVKDKLGNVSSIDNHRPITLCPVSSISFQMVQLHLYNDYSAIDDR